MEKTATKNRYHHGDLRTALLDTGMRLLETRGSADIGLREVARETGVSATAVYRHFPDKGALIGALAAVGYDMLADVQEEAAAGETNTENAFRAVGQAYVHFALAHPALFRLMTSQSFVPEDCPDGEIVGDNRAGRLLKSYIAELLPPEASDLERNVAATQALSLVYGLAQLVLAGQVPNDPDMINAVVNDFGKWNS